MAPRIRTLAILFALSVVAGSCSSTAAPPTTLNSSDTSPTATESADDSPTDKQEPIEAGANSLDLELFFDGALAEDVTTEDCTLSGGEESTCFRITIAGYPAGRDPGPFCPTSTGDGPEAGGLWFDGNGVYEVDGAFILSLPELYSDDEWMLHNDDGKVNVIETAEEFDAAARPDVDPDLQNHCVEGRLEWLENGEPVQTTVLIPTTPTNADNPSETRGSPGITLEGVVIDGPAPVDAILGAYTIAAFDDCGGHYNPTAGYHMHGVTGCSEHDEAPENETPILGYAIDGYPIHSPMEELDLDECNGHTTEEAGYHYHANSAEKNQVLPCLVGQTAQSDSEDGRGGPPGDGQGPPDGERPPR